MTYYKVLRRNDAGDLVSCHGGNHIWEPGVTYGPVEVYPCFSGFHACRVEDLGLWLADDMVVCEVELSDVIETADKVVGSTAILGRYLGMSGPMDLVRIAVFATEQVMHLDPRVREAIEAAKAVVDGDSAPNERLTDVVETCRSLYREHLRAGDHRAMYTIGTAWSLAATANDAEYRPIIAGNTVRAARVAQRYAGLSMPEIADLRGRLGEYVLSLLRP